MPAVRRGQGRFRRRGFLISVSGNTEHARGAPARIPSADAPRVCYTLRAVHIAVPVAFFHTQYRGLGSPRSSMDRTSAS
ncbi:hypothetical protein EMIT0158MI4_60152 [Burkholderia ambifaria]